MKKITSVLLSLSTALSILAPMATAESGIDGEIHLNPNPIIDLTTPATDFIVSQDLEGAKKYETVGNPNATYEFVDPKLARKNNSEVTPQAGDRRVYVKSAYVVSKSVITGYSVGPMEQQTLLISVPKGKTSSKTSQSSISGTVKNTAKADVGIKYVVNQSLTGEVSGTISKSWGTTEVYSGPPESSAFNTRNYYAAINYDQYNIVVVKYDYYDEYVGSVFQERVAVNAGYTYLDGTKKPIIIEYPVDVKY
ncbi:hypothetical protein HUB98_22495 [Paenibacillus barcinonensis]|uniref:Toxin ETX/toxin MTX2 n=1 Tax=Paenibacillus barcinonensis TaxID=198119 RepID=A0A2V4V7G4_PAEBA|nr:hypothetical protein [Paenibacillus barcinonensis]PYE48590.1 hypothetical protein DFQ00_108182 [Paenibacillus barcinonensis]QKS58717.1 hypothetical protein HUB98_22495 [Paenibacillus barcinonensis]